MEEKNTVTIELGEGLREQLNKLFIITDEMKAEGITGVVNYNVSVPIPEDSVIITVKYRASNKFTEKV